MDLRSKIVIVLFFVLLVAAAIWKYQVYFVERDYLIYNQIACDPTEESCFAYLCEEDDEECDDTPYKKIEKYASNIAVCDEYAREDCPELTCEESEFGCIVTACSEDTLEDGEQCVTEEPSSEEDMLDEESLLKSGDGETLPDQEASGSDE